MVQKCLARTVLQHRRALTLGGPKYRKLPKTTLAVFAKPKGAIAKLAHPNPKASPNLDCYFKLPGGEQLRTKVLVVFGKCLVVFGSFWLFSVFSATGTD